jgi:uncharacterized protein (TIGR02217 family)
MFIESPRFPDQIAYGAVGGPQFLTHIVDSISGAEARQQQWPLGPAVYDLSLEHRDEALTRELIAFFRVCAKGQAHGFRFHDFQPGEDRGVQELLGYGNGTHTTWQLIKQYIIGGLAYARTILKPVPGTVVAYLNETEAAPGSYAVDSTTGLLTFATPPPMNATVRATYLFDVPVRFTVDWLPVQGIAPGVWSWESVQLKEIRPGAQSGPLLECSAVLDGLVLCWDMNELSGNRVDHIHGVPLYPVGNPVGSAGRYATAVQCVKASGQYLYNPTAFEDEWIGGEYRHFLHYSAFTILFWVYVDAYPPDVGENEYFGNSAGLLTNAPHTFINDIDFEILLQSTGGIFASFSGGLGGTIGGPETGPVAPIPLRQWTLLQFWREIFPTAPRVALHYQADNGPIITDLRTTFDTSQLPLDFFCVGAVGGTGGAASRFFDGKIDRVMMWNRALTTEERASFWG